MLSFAMSFSRRTVPILSLATVMAGCMTESGRLGGFGDSETSAGAGDTDTGSGTSDRLDLGSGASGTGGGDGTANCDQVDILFVVDTSGSMLAYQRGLAEAFPQFVDAMFEVLPEQTDLHVGVTTTAFCDGTAQNDEGGHNEDVLVDCSSPDRPGHTQMWYAPPTETTIPGNGRQGRLVEVDGRSWFAANTSDPASREPLTQWFTAAATRGAGCNFEYTAAAAAYAVHPVNETANTGFLRDEGAVLLIFVLSDEYDESPEGLLTYRDMILEAKAGCGGERCVLTAGLINEVCSPDHEPFVWQFLNAFSTPPVWGAIGTSLGWPLDPDTSHYPDVVGDALANAVATKCASVPPAP